MKIILVRHGESEGNIKHLPQITSDTSLTEEGIKQAKEVAKKLQEFNISKILCSDMLRAKQTCKEYLNLKSDIESIEDSRLREIYRVIIGGPEREGTPEDRFEKDKARAEEIFNEILSNDEDIMIFAHGNIIRYFISRALNIDPKELWEKINLSYCSISILKKKDGKFELEIEA